MPEGSPLLLGQRDRLGKQRYLNQGEQKEDQWTPREVAGV